MPVDHLPGKGPGLLGDVYGALKVTPADITSWVVGPAPDQRQHPKRPAGR